MSTNSSDITCCANCGKGEESTGDLKECSACKMVKYCNRDCQIAHRPQHKKACKKRAAKLHDEALFKQPPLLDDCPICMLPLPSMTSGRLYLECCGKILCKGCIHAVAIRDRHEQKCAFCRTPAPKSNQEVVKRIKKREKVDDSNAIYNIGCYYNEGLGNPEVNFLHRRGSNVVNSPSLLS